MKNKLRVEKRSSKWTTIWAFSNLKPKRMEPCRPRGPERIFNFSPGRLYCPVFSLCGNDALFFTPRETFGHPICRHSKLMGSFLSVSTIDVSAAKWKEHENSLDILLLQETLSPAGPGKGFDRWQNVSIFGKGCNCAPSHEGVKPIFRPLSVNQASRPGAGSGGFRLPSGFCATLNSRKKKVSLRTRPEAAEIFDVSVLACPWNKKQCSRQLQCEVTSSVSSQLEAEI